MYGTLHGAHLGGASALALSLQLGAASAGSLDSAVTCVDELAQSSFVMATAPLAFAEGGGGGGGVADSSNTIPGTPIRRIDSNTEQMRDDVNTLLSIDDDDNSVIIHGKIMDFPMHKYVRWEDITSNDVTMHIVDSYHVSFDLLDTLLDDDNPEIVFHAIRYISQRMMPSVLAEAIYPGSQMTYRGRFFMRSREVWNRGMATPPEKTTPMHELVRSLGTDRNAIQPSATKRLDQIVTSDDDGDFDALVETISAESTSLDIARSTSAAFAFVLSARLIENEGRLLKLLYSYLDNVAYAASMFRDEASYWIPMGAVADAGNLIDDPKMYTAFLKSFSSNLDSSARPSAFAVPTILHLAANLRGERRITALKELVNLNKPESIDAIRKIVTQPWRFTVAERGVAEIGLQVLREADNSVDL